MTRSAVILLSLALGGCVGPPIRLELEFPSVTTFVRADSVQIFVRPLADPTDGCLSFLDQAEMGTLEGGDLDVDALSVCEFLENELVDNPGVALPGAADGRYAYIAVGRGGSTAYLTGCTILSLDTEDREAVRIPLSPTDAYRTQFGTTVSSCTTDQKCGTGCP